MDGPGFLIPGKDPETPGGKDIEKTEAAKTTEKEDEKEQQEDPAVPETNRRIGIQEDIIAAGTAHTVGLEADGTAAVTGSDRDAEGRETGQCDVSDRGNIHGN